MQTRIRALRRTRLMTQADLADAAGVRIATISKAERTPESVEVSTMLSIAEALGVTLADLFAPDKGDDPVRRLADQARTLHPDDLAVLERVAAGLRARGEP